jgi:hypothetical protein
MKTLIFSVVAVVFLGHAAVADTYVRGHYRNDGTYVQPHVRSSPDNSYNNNWSVQPNVNPYTGQLGTKQPTWNDQAPPSNSLYGGSNRARW